MTDLEIGPCEDCGEVRPLRHVWEAGDELWLCPECGADRHQPPPRPDR